MKNLVELEICLNCEYMRKEGTVFYCIADRSLVMNRVYSEVHPLWKGCDKFKRKKKKAYNGRRVER